MLGTSIEFGSEAKAVVRVLGESSNMIGDAFITYRLRKLAQAGAVEALNSKKSSSFNVDPSATTIETGQATASLRLTSQTTDAIGEAGLARSIHQVSVHQ
jgi:hypothetical protein